eukprot:Pgem_evm1s17127
MTSALFNVGSQIRSTYMYPKACILLCIYYHQLNNNCYGHIMTKPTLLNVSYRLVWPCMVAIGWQESAQIYYQHIKAFLEQHDFHESTLESCLFLHNSNDTRLMIFIDDYILKGNDQTILIIKQLQQRFPLNQQTGDITIIGIQIHRTDYHTILHQQQYIETIQRKHQIVHNIRATTPIPVKNNIKDHHHDPTVSKLNEHQRKLYETYIGIIRFLADTSRPDLAYAAHRLAQYVKQPYQPHARLAERTLQYAINTKQWGLYYTHQTTDQPIIQCHAHSDSSLADVYPAKTTCGYLVTTYSHVTSWAAHNSEHTIHSSTEAEIVSADYCIMRTQYIKSLQKLLQHHATTTPLPITIYVDNDAARVIAMQQTSPRRVRHMDIKYFYIKEKVNNNEYTIQNINGLENPSDLLTKPIPAQRHIRLMNTFMRPLNTLNPRAQSC